MQNNDVQYKFFGGLFSGIGNQIKSGIQTGVNNAVGNAIGSVFPGFGGSGSGYGGGYGSYLQGAENLRKQQEAQLKAQKDEFEYQKAVRAPGIAGAQAALKAGHWVDAEGNVVPEGTEGANFVSQFQPFVDQSRANALGAQKVASNYLNQAPEFQQAGLTGLRTMGALAAFSPFQQQQLQDQLAQGDIQAQYNMAARDINRSADAQARDAALQRGTFGALGTQAARQVAAAEEARTKALSDAAVKARTEAYNRGQAELQRQAQLAGSLYQAGGTGLSAAQQAATLGSGAIQQGVQAPFLPFQQYGLTTGQQQNVSVPTFQRVVDPNLYASGLAQSFNRG